VNRVAIKPEMLRWARERASRSAEGLAVKFPKLSQWERGEAQPTLKQLEQFARATFTPVGYLFLQDPPIERIPIPDLRTLRNWRLEHPSPDLLDTIYMCQNRQTWYQEWARAEGEKACAFVGSAKVDSPVEETAADMRQALGFDLDARKSSPTWTDALRQFIAQADHVGVLVMVSGVVGSNNHRKLDPQEFRGFALSDPLAPLVFINGADTKAAQMFTLAHELAHLWLGESALTDVAPASAPTQRIESWCNRVAAELLVPLTVLREELPRGDVLGEVQRLAKRFKVSTLVILRRLLDARRLTREEFDAAYEEELARLLKTTRTSGGDFYLTLGARAGKTFARALVVSTLGGRTSFTEAFRLLGFKKMATFRELAQGFGVGF
jgi:Zn-dependent peptidase ImmA (M78 family)/transcriptional regulator with XRE-family HTH domain